MSRYILISTEWGDGANILHTDILTESHKAKAAIEPPYFFIIDVSDPANPLEFRSHSGEFKPLTSEEDDLAEVAMEDWGYSEPNYTKICTCGGDIRYEADEEGTFYRLCRKCGKDWMPEDVKRIYG